MAEKPKNPKFHDLEGSRYGILTVKSFSGIRKSCTYWNVVCDCGKEKEVGARHLVDGGTTSCGCMKNELARINNTTHGEGTKTKESLEFRSWSSMRSRCNNPNNDKFHLYGARGIKVCPRWDSYENFLEDMGRKPSPEHSIDRVDNNGDYCPDNCHWATKKEQARNRRSNVIIEYDGRSQCQSAWCEEFGISTACFRGRLKLGWTVERALTQPVQKNSKAKEDHGICN